MTLYGEPQVWREQFPLGEARPFTHDYHGLRYPGEVVRAEAWSPRWGEPLRGDIFFRIIMLRQRRGGLHPNIRDPRSVLCLPASGLSRRRGRLTGELGSVRETQTLYSTLRNAEGELVRRILQRHQEGLEEPLMAEESARYAAGGMVTHSDYHTSLAHLFAGVDPLAWFSRIAQWLLLQAYPTLPIDACPPLPRPVAGEDAAHLHRAIFDQPGATHQILAELGPGLGLSSSASPVVFDPSSCPVYHLIRGRLSGQPAPASWADVHHYLSHQVGLTGPLATLYLLTFLRWEQPELEVRLLPDHQLTLVGGRALRGNRLTGDLVPLLLWDPPLAGWASTIGPAAPPAWNDALPYLSVLSPGGRAVAPGQDFQLQERKLLESIGQLVDSLAVAKGFLERLGWPGDEAEVGGPAGSLERLAQVRGDDFQSIYRVVRSVYGDYRRLEADLATLGRVIQLSRCADEVLAAGEYLDGARVPARMAELSVERQALLALLAPGSLLQSPSSWEALAQQVGAFQSRYAAAYREHHKRFHRDLPAYQSELEAARSKLRALALLNSLPELGDPVGEGLAPALDQLNDVPPSCSVEAADLDLGSNPWCPACRLSLEQGLPTTRLARLAPRIDAALAEKNQRLSSLLVARILRGQVDQRLEDFVKIVQSSDLSALSSTLNEELLSFVRQLLG